MANIIEVVNTILDQGSEEYQARVPQATRDNIEAVANPILAMQTTTNEFLNALVNQVVLMGVRKRTLINKLAPLKEGTTPLGKNLQEIMVNPAKGKDYGDSSYTLLTKHTPEVLALYHSINRRQQYPVSIYRDKLRTAFTSWEGLGQLIEEIINSLYSGDSLDEFILMKNLIADAVVSGKTIFSKGTEISAASGPKDLLKAIKNAGTYMQFAGSQFNTYKAQATAAGLTNPVDAIVWTQPEDLRLIVRADVITEMEVEYLATVFNLSKAEWAGHIIPVDNFGAAETDSTDTVHGISTYALLCDKSWLVVNDILREMGDFYDPKEKAWNYYWDVWQRYSISLFANAMAFGYEKPLDPG